MVYQYLNDSFRGAAVAVLVTTFTILLYSSPSVNDVSVPWLNNLVKRSGEVVGNLELAFDGGDAGY